MKCIALKLYPILVKWLTYYGLKKSLMYQGVLGFLIMNTTKFQDSLKPKLPRNVGTRMSTPLFETRYLGTSKVLQTYIYIYMCVCVKIYKNKTFHTPIIHAYLIFLNSMIHMNIRIENLKHKVINLINHMTQIHSRYQLED